MNKGTRLTRWRPRRWPTVRDIVPMVWINVRTSHVDPAEVSSTRISCIVEVVKVEVDVEVEKHVYVSHYE